MIEARKLDPDNIPFLLLEAIESVDETQIPKD